MTKRIAILGAGASGLTAIKCCLDEGLTPVCFERTDHIGGLWYYTDKATDGQACVMKSTVINTTKETMCYSDFPIPADFPVYMHNTKVLQYFNSYGSLFDAKKYIRFNTEIEKVTPADSFQSTGQWKLTVTDRITGSRCEEVFDGVLVCTGHHAEKNIPQFEGMKEFKGEIVHTHDYRNHVGFEDKRVVVIGIGNSGGDVAVELSRISSQVYLSTRRGSWVINRISDHGYPLMSNRFKSMMRSKIPYGSYLFTKLAESKLNRRFNHDNFGLKPKHHLHQQHPTVNDELPNRIACGTIIVKPDIKRFTAHGVEFVDGKTVDDIDTIILATGYKFGFPFVDHSALDVENNKVNLYKYIFPPDLKHGTLAVIGCVQPLGAIMPISEMQCRWATKVIKGSLVLPSEETMVDDIRMKETVMKARYVASPRHTIQVDFIAYMDEIAHFVGCRPDFNKLFWDDPVLAWRCIMGPFTPYQYRLMGPEQWSGARQAILTIWDRILAPTRSAKIVENRSIPVLVYILAIIVVAVMIRWTLNWLL